ncbi:M20/M25/M40 family metallo-hydrolase, partial [Acinetobacter baumannii]
INHPQQTAYIREVALQGFGSVHVVPEFAPRTASEDFAFILERCPGSYLVIGNGQGESGCQLHNPGYDFNDDCLAVGASYWVRLAERFLA